MLRPVWSPVANSAQVRIGVFELAGSFMVSCVQYVARLRSVYYRFDLCVFVSVVNGARIVAEDVL